MVYTVMLGLLVLLVLLVCLVLLASGWWRAARQTEALKRELREAKTQMQWLDTRMREASDARAAYKTLSHQHGQVLAKIREAEDEVHWLRSLIRHHGLKHLLERPLESPFWQISGTPAPDRVYTFLDPAEEKTDPGVKKLR